MALQLQNFTPIEPQHYTLAETQSEKEAEMARQMARDAANNAAQASTHAMGLEAANAQHAATLAANGQQSAVENDLNKQRINAGINQVGLANAREQEKNNATAAQNAIDNKRQAFADQNTLQQQGLSNARTAKADAHSEQDRQRADVAWQRANDFATKTYDLAGIGEVLSTAKTDAKGHFDLGTVKEAVDRQTYGLTKQAKNITGKVMQGKLDIYADGKQIKMSQPLESIDYARRFVANGGKSPDTNDRYKTFTYTDDNGEKQTGLFDVLTKKPVQTSPLQNELGSVRASFQK